MGAETINRDTMKFTDLPTEDRAKILDSIQAKVGLKSAIIEKDWWVTAVLRALFKLPYAEYMSFKGGTSLSKCWKVIERMSEDIDIGIARDYLGNAGSLSKNQISDKLRRAACSFVRTRLQHDLKEQMLQDGISSDNFNIRVDITSVSTTDPEVIWVEYKPAIQPIAYLPPVVKIEVSGRSMTEPISNIEICSLTDAAAPTALFAEKKFPVRAVMAKRTFLEKLFLLHEEFSKEEGNIRIDRMSRHLYDIYKMLNTDIAKDALTDNNLYNIVIEHRKTFIGLKGFDYSTLKKSTLNIIPPTSVYAAWKKDYETMQQEMIYGESVSFDVMIKALKALNKTINNMK